VLGALTSETHVR